MADKKLELNNENLDNVLGGMNIVNRYNLKYITPSNDHSTRYYFDDLSVLTDYYLAHRDTSLSTDENDVALIAGMLDAGLIRTEP